MQPRKNPKWKERGAILAVPSPPPSKPSFQAPTQSLEHIVFNNTGTAKAESTFNLNVEAISKHVAIRLKFDGPLIALAVRKLKEPIINFPNNPTDLSNLVETTKWQREFNHKHDQKQWWSNNKQKIYNLVLQHSAPKMKTKLLMMDSWEVTSGAQDRIVLLKLIRNICHKRKGGTNATTILDLVRMDKDMFLIQQTPNELLSSYLSKFKGAVDVVESSEGSPWSHPAATKIVFDKIFDPKDHAAVKENNSTDYKTVATEAQRRYLAALFFTDSATTRTKNSRRRS